MQVKKYLKRKKLSNNKNMKNKQFVRPTCNKPWYFTCVVCCKSHKKWGAHSECYKRYCDYCKFIYKTPEELRDHALQWHKKNFCEKCNMTVRYLKKHQSNFH